MNAKQVILIIVVLAIIVAGFFLFNNDTRTVDEPLDGAMDTDTSTDVSEFDDEDTDDSESEETLTQTITYTANGFMSTTVEIPVGGTVTWVNESARDMWVASDVHPTHTIYDGTTLLQHCQGGSSDSFDQCGSGNTYSFTFDQAGTWDYHNHRSANHTGTIVVTD